MFESATEQLYNDYCILLKRIEKGYLMVYSLPEESGEMYEKYIKQISYLAEQADRASDCLAILQRGD